MASSLKGQQIPEDETIDYYYHSSDSESSDKDGPTVQYPIDNLGTSWGSYLYSGPPTRAGAPGTLYKKALKTNADFEGKPDEKQTTLSPLILKESKLASEGHTKEQQERSIESALLSSKNETHADSVLLIEVQRLMDQLNTTESDLNNNGSNTEHLRSLANKAKTTYSTLQNICASASGQNNIEKVSRNTMADLSKYLVEVLKSLSKQSLKIKQDAERLQKTAKQLSRTQDQFYKEQREIHEVIEAAKIQLVKDRKLFEADISRERDLKIQNEKLQARQETVPVKTHKQTHKSSLGTVHEVMQARNHHTAIIQTQNVQTKLEKSLLKQQRDLQRLRKDLDFIKTEMLSTQDHAMKIEHRFLMYKKRAAIPEADSHKAQAKKDFKIDADSKWKAIISSQLTLNSKVSKLRRQLDEHYVCEEQLNKQLEESFHSLRKGAAILKQSPLRGKEQRIPIFTNSTDMISLHDQQQLQRKPHCLKQEKKLKVIRKRPTYTFSKQELVSLACFSDEEASDSVLEWLQHQGTLPQ